MTFVWRGKPVLAKEHVFTKANHHEENVWILFSRLAENDLNEFMLVQMN